MDKETLMMRGLSDLEAGLLMQRSNMFLNRELEKNKVDPLELPPYFKDRRTNEEYINDIIEGRLVEDAMFLIFNNMGLKVELGGSDKGREIFRDGSKISSEQDLVVNGSKVEIQMARKSLSSYDMKEYKVKNMIRDNSCIFWILVETGEFFAIKSKHIDLMEKKVNAKRGGKVVYNIAASKLKEQGMLKTIRGLSSTG